MKKILIMCLILTTFLGNLVAQDASYLQLNGTEWNGSVFGDVGGDNVITPENFEITQKSEDSFVLRSSNNRGKIASSSEGIAFLYQEINTDEDFEMAATVEVLSYEMNNQVSFGIMLRDTVLENTATKENLGSYIAVGPVNITKEPAMTVFYRSPDVKTKKVNPMNYSAKPNSGLTYDVIMEKSGNSFTLIFGDEDPYEIEDLSIFNGEKLYIGVYTSRNTTVKYTELTLNK